MDETSGADETTVRGPLSCPGCAGALDQHGPAVVCRSCAATYAALDGGYLDLMPPGSSIAHRPAEEYLADQINHGAARAERWLLRQLRPDDRVALDVGCGSGSIGKAVAALNPSLETWGVDLPGNLPGWRDAGADAQRVVAGSALDLPFEAESFDVVWSLGVLEHIGEPSPPSERSAARLRYVAELLRVLRPGGRVIVVAPHKWFPLDPAHDWSNTQLGHWFFERTHLCVHRTWGSHQLMSYREVRRLARACGASRIRPLSLADYFSFERTGSSGAARVVPAARMYLKRLPEWMGATPFAPFLAVELTRALAEDSATITASANGSLTNSIR